MVLKTINFIKHFKKLNPEADEQVIDWESIIDKKENKNINLSFLEAHYPQFRWFNDELPLESLVVDALRQEIEHLRHFPGKNRTRATDMILKFKKLTQEIKINLERNGP